MQVAKNLFLSRERTLSRKLEELVLAWHMETSLSRDRILEIYLNIIEFGPGIYGISEAASALFGKTAAELQPNEAAYFSAIVPRPSSSYATYCQGEIDVVTAKRMRRALTLLVNAGDLSPEDWQAAVATKLEFSTPANRAACMLRRDRALYAAR
jgi:membrane peptidoglycan carboxypeptidase